MAGTATKSARVAAVLVGLALITLGISVQAGGTEPPIPELARWESQMLSFGQVHCASVTQLLSLEQLFWAIEYDAGRVYYQIADYTGDPFWSTCGQLAEAVYRDQYVLPINGGAAGHVNYTTGLRMDYRHTGQVASQQAAVLLSQNAAYAKDGTPLEWTRSADFSREVAFAVLSYINAEALGEPPRQRRVAPVPPAPDPTDPGVVRVARPGPPGPKPGQTTPLAPFLG